MKHPTRGLGRRSFLAMCGGSVLLAYWLRSAIGRAQGAPGPKRLVLIHRPNGSIAEDWSKNGARGSILEPFAGVWPHAVALRGVDVRPSNGTTGGSHEAGLLTIMTGAKLGPTFRTNDDFRSTARSLDQTLLAGAPALGGRPVPSLQLAAHGEQDGGNETPNVTMSYSGPDSPLYPVLDPDDVYTRLFGDLPPGGVTDPNLQELARKRARRASVLDFVNADLARVRAQFPASFKEDLDMHAEAIRELEKGLDATPGAICKAPTISNGVRAGGDYLNVDKVGSIHFDLMTAALVCDLTRVVTFMWGTGASRMQFGPLGSDNHHSTSHANKRDVLSTIDRWFSEKTAAFVQRLVGTDDPAGGKLIDKTLVWYLSEVSEGWNHSFDGYPFVFFGGDSVGLKNRGRILDVSGQGKTSNDIWTSIAPVFGASLTSFATKHSGPVDGFLQV